MSKSTWFIMGASSGPSVSGKHFWPPPSATSPVADASGRISSEPIGCSSA